MVCQTVFFSQQTWSGQLPKTSCGIESSRVFDCLDFGSSTARQSANFGRIWLPNSTDFEPFLFRLVSARFGPFWLVLARSGSFWLVLARFGSFWLGLAGQIEPKPSRNRAETQPKLSQIRSETSAPQIGPRIFAGLFPSLLSFRTVGKLRRGGSLFLTCLARERWSLVHHLFSAGQFPAKSTVPPTNPRVACVCLQAHLSLHGVLFWEAHNTPRNSRGLRDLLGSSSPQFRGPTGLKMSRETTLLKKQSAKIWLENW